MKGKDLKISFTVDQSPEVVFEAINNVGIWWGGITGTTDKMGAKFTHRYKNIHRSTQKITRLVPGKQVVWQVVQSKLTHAKNQTEWNGTRIVFDIRKKGKKTEVRFTHFGLVPAFECYGQCKGAWGQLVGENLKALIERGKPSSKDIRISFAVDVTPQQVFQAIQNVKGWWSKKIAGKSRKKGDVFRFRYGTMHDSTQKLIEVVPGKKIVWLITKANLSFTKDKQEWVGTQVHFDIAKQGKKTRLNFRHTGLTPKVECFKACSEGWGFYVGKSLKDLIVKGKGQPT